MKKLAMLLVLCVLLCGCSGKTGETIPAPAETVPVLTATETQTPSVETPEDGLIREPDIQTEPEEEEISIPQGQAGYSTLENDHSIRNDAGDILVGIGYEQVILDTSVETFRKVNERIAEDYREFLSDMSWLNETSPQEWETRLQDMGSLQSSFLSIRTAEVTCNSGGIFSIRMTQESYLGGVYNCDYYGLNFDLITGEPLALSSLSELPETELLDQLKGIVIDQVSENRDALLEDPETILEEYTLKDFSFCIEEGELVLLFPTYTFGPGVMGATQVRTGLYPVL